MISNKTRLRFYLCVAIAIGGFFMVTGYNNGYNILMFIGGLLVFISSMSFWVVE